MSDGASRRSHRPDARRSAMWASRAASWQAKLAPSLPGVPPDDLNLILLSLLRPPGVPRRWLLIPVNGHGHVL